MTNEEVRGKIIEAVKAVRESNPLAPSITNTVTINFVANAQLAVGGSAAMVYLQDEGESMARLGGAMYINMGTMFHVYAETLPRTARRLAEEGKPWVLDPVGIGIGGLRESLLLQFSTCPPSIIRGNASEIMALAKLWNLTEGASGTVRGVDSTDEVESAREAAVALARHIKGAVAVSGQVDLVTDGNVLAYSEGGSHFMPKITGAGCSLGGVMAVYAAQAEPFIAALAGAAVYNLAGKRAEQKAKGPSGFQVQFIDELYLATAEDIADNPLHIERA